MDARKLYSFEAFQSGLGMGPDSLRGFMERRRAFLLQPPASTQRPPRQRDSETGVRLQQFPGPGDVRFRRTHLTHGQPQHERAVEPRVRQEHVARRVHGVEQPFVERVTVADGYVLRGTRGSTRR